jgi:molybdopterin-guanine dinucleotide biosynthesis protein A
MIRKALLKKRLGDKQPPKRMAPRRIFPEVHCMILAGGASRRMGQDKANLSLGTERRTFLQHIQDCAREVCGGCGVVRRDAMPSCGPLSGLWTGLKRSRASWVLFLACDMPSVQPGLLRRVIRTGLHRQVPVAVAVGDRLGFPVLLPRQALDAVKAQIASGNLSLGALFRRLRANRVTVRGKEARELININTPADLARACRMARGQGVKAH